MSDEGEMVPVFVDSKFSSTIPICATEVILKITVGSQRHLPSVQRAGIFGSLLFQKDAGVEPIASVL